MKLKTISETNNRNDIKKAASSRPEKFVVKKENGSVVPKIRND